MTDPVRCVWGVVTQPGVLPTQKPCNQSIRQRDGWDTDPEWAWVHIDEQDRAIERGHPATPPVEEVAQ